MSAVPMTQRPRPRTILLTACVLAAGTFLAGQLTPRQTPVPGGPSSSQAESRPTTGAVQPPADSAPGKSGSAGSLDQIDAAIATWSANLERDGADFIAATHLAELYLARGRVTGLAEDYARASEAVETALATEPDLLSARLLGAQVLLDSHDFAGGAAAAQAILDDHPQLPQALAALGDARLEMGDYLAAERAYAELSTVVDAPAVTARRAKLIAVTGSLSVARGLANRALDAALADPATSAADQAFYHLLVGTLAFQAGDLAAAESAFVASLELTPSSEPAAANLGRVLAAQGRRTEAMAVYERAIETAPHPDTLGALADLLLLAGRTEEAERRYAQVRELDALRPEEAGLVSVDRAVIIYLADHGEQTRLAVRLAEEDLARRGDVHGWDALAWALLADGRVAEADEAMRKALQLGTQDPLLDYHAGMIAAAAGRTAEAVDLLGRALAVNPNFDPLQANRARAQIVRLTGDE